MELFVIHGLHVTLWCKGQMIFIHATTTLLCPTHSMKIECWMFMVPVSKQFETWNIKQKCKGRRKRGNIVAEAKMRPGRKKCFCKISKAFLLPRRRFCVFNICCIGEQTRNHLANTEETLTSNVSSFAYPSNMSWRRRIYVSEAKMFCFLRTHTTLWATLTQNVSAAMFPRLRRP